MDDRARDPLDETLRTALQALQSWRLLPLVAAALHAHRPLAFVVGQVAHATAPLIAPWDRHHRLAGLAALLSDESPEMTVDRFLALVDEGGNTP